MNHAQFWGGAAGAYEIDQSLRFDGSSGKLTRTNPASSGITNAYKWSYSFWIKHSDVSSSGTITQPLLSGGNTSGSGRTFCGWGYSSAGRFWIGNFNGSQYIPDIRPTDRVWRDPSAWEHFMLVYDTSESTNTDRIKIYSNGVRWNPTGGVGSTISAAQVFYAVNYATRASNIGYDNILNTYFDGYMAEVHFVDGQALDQYSFGEFDTNGAWRPIKYTGTYGLNGHYLKFDPSATNGIGHDHSGNGNNFSPTGFSTSGTGTDVMSDTPTTNWCTLNPVFNTAAGSITSNGNLNASFSSDSVTGTIGPASGKWYFEVTVDSISTNAYIGIADQTLFVDTSGFSYSQVYVYLASAVKGGNGSTSSYGATYGAGDVIGVAYDLDAGSITFYKNGTSQGVAFNSGFGSGYNYRPFSFAQGGGQTFNFGQRAFAYTPPTGYKALNTANLPAPDIADGSQYFNTVLYTGNGASPRAITGVGFAPDFTWIKLRSQATNHVLQDKVRGATAYLNSNNTQPENTNTQVNFFSSFDSDGFTVRYTAANGFSYWETNLSGNTYAAWNWKANGSGSSNTAGSITSTVSANPTAGFSIVSWPGTGAAATVGHGLGVPLDMFITKNRDTTVGWGVYHKDLGGNTKYLNLNDTSAVNTNAIIWNSTSPTSTVFSVGGDGTSNGTGEDMVAYCFAEVEGYSKFGKYAGNSSTDGTFVYTGFRPAFVMCKNTQGGSWFMHDTTRMPYNPAPNELLANSSLAEGSSYPLDILSNGFKWRSASGEVNTGPLYIFAAFAEHPFGGANVSPATAR
jgi:hypothetical protein